jgi:hypothetical protein
MVRQEFDLAMALSGCPTLSSIFKEISRIKTELSNADLGF